MQRANRRRATAVKSAHPKRKSIATKMISLSAVGAGALVFGAHDAEAGIIYSGPINAQVGFDTGFGASYTSPVLAGGSQQFSFFRTKTTYPGFFGPYTVFSRAIGASGIGPFLGRLRFATSSSVLQLFNAGATWNARYSDFVTALVALRTWTYPLGSHDLDGQTSFDHQYGLFAFGCPAGTCYGWVQLKLDVTDAPGLDGKLGPNLTIYDYAYDDSGAIIGAGEGATPEPSTFAMTGLAALALGAAGLRRWRAARKS